MAVVRYVALIALVVWVAGMLPVAIRDALREPYLSFGSGGLVLVSLVVLKFVGPPPRAFFVRTGLVAAMLAVAALAWLAYVSPAIAVRVNLALGAVLLFWYVHE